jgi:hypothetical protein
MAFIDSPTLNRGSWVQASKIAGNLEMSVDAPVADRDDQKT